MNTMRSTATATALLSILTLAGCGASGSTDTPPSATSSEQPVAEWLPAATPILDDLTADLDALNAVVLSDPASLPTDPHVTSLASTAERGLDLKAPAGHPDLDRAWDAVMNDYLLVSGDFAGGDTDQAVTDLGTASADTDTLQSGLSAL
jgi:predicted small lipoprotein YifL